MRNRISLVIAGLATVLASGGAFAAGPVRDGRSVAVASRGYVQPLQRGHRLARRGHLARYADLKGDPGSGLGFYALPYAYRLGAWRYRQRQAYARYPNPVLSAVAADAARYYGIPGDRGYRYGVFDPNEGVGTPFFAGYYGPGDGDDPPPPFGRPYR